METGISKRSQLRTRIGQFARCAAFLFVIYLGWDYFQYHSRLRHAMSVVSNCGGSAGSLMDWPFGRELRITFTHPPTEADLQRLEILNGLNSRHWVGVMYKCELTDEELRRIESTLGKCHVIHVVDGEIQRKAPRKIP